ncbi:MAG: ATP-binding protein [Bacteroidales bacterium]|nr:ATP-binding protein [Bacteroidales bacterium]
MKIKRSIEDEVKNYCKIFPVIAILGPRQCGKTTFVKYYAAKNIDSYVYLDLEKITDYNKLENAQFYFEQNKNKCIIIDEIQRKPELFPLIRSIVDENKKNCKFIILGSASPELIKQSSETLAGRIGYIKLDPFSFGEISDKYDLKKHHFYGGFPLAYLSENNDTAKIWLDNFIKTYIERDLPMLGLKANPVTVRRLWQMLAWQTGNLINYNTLASSLKVTNKTVANYIDFLENSYIVYRLQPYFYNIKKRLVKTPKIFISDTGLLHRLLQISDYEQLLGNQLVGNSWENYIINQIKIQKNKDTELFFYRTHAGAELDLLLVKGLKPIASVEIKFTENPKISKGFICSTETLKTTQNYIIIPTQNEDYKIKENITVCGFDIFLDKYLINI